MKYIVEHLHSKFIFWSNIRFTLYYGRNPGFNPGFTVQFPNYIFENTQKVSIGFVTLKSERVEYKSKKDYQMDIEKI